MEERNTRNDRLLGVRSFSWLAHKTPLVTDHGGVAIGLFTRPLRQHILHTVSLRPSGSFTPPEMKQVNGRI